MRLRTILKNVIQSQIKALDLVLNILPKQPESYDELKSSK